MSMLSLWPCRLMLPDRGIAWPIIAKCNQQWSNNLSYEYPTDKALLLRNLYTRGHYQ